MNLPHVFTFNQDGTVEGLWSELLPLNELGTMAMSRVSNVDFNEATQQWEVCFIESKGVVRFSHSSRDECIAWEHDYFNAKWLHGVTPIAA